MNTPGDPVDGLLWLDAERQVHSGPAAAGPTPLWATWGRRDAEDRHSWPCRPPVGGGWAAFRVGRGGPSRIVVCAADGAEHETEDFGEAVPIYLQWSPSGRRLAALLQRADRLELVVVDRGAEQHTRWLEGSPLFFAWYDDDRIVAHVGRSAARNEVVVVSASGVSPFPGSPASFCAPVPTPWGVVWSAVHHGHGGILTTAIEGLPSRELEVVDGLLAFVPRADGRVLRAVSTDGDGRTYRDLRLLDPRSGRSSRVSDTEIVAFLPIPSGTDGGDQPVIVVRRNPRRGSLVFSRISADGRTEEHVADIIPSRDLRFFVRFFEQFAHSHPLVDPQGRALVVSGTLVGGPGPERPRVHVFPLSGGAPRDLGEGPFGCFAPAPAPRVQGVQED